VDPPNPEVKAPEFELSSHCNYRYKSCIERQSNADQLGGQNDLVMKVRKECADVHFYSNDITVFLFLYPG
jgi:hypothetical protein